MRNFYYDIIYKIASYIEMFKRMLFWGWKMRWNFDFDGQYVYNILHLKLVRMYKCFINHGHCLWTNDINDPLMRKLRIAIECSKRLKEDEYILNCYNMSKKEGRNKTKAIYKRYDDIQKNDKRLLFKILEKNLDSFWD
jgi:hypothetical protein